MVDFLQKASICISIIKSISKSENNMISLSQIVKVNSFIIKAKKIADIFNTTIIDRKIAEFLKN